MILNFSDFMVYWRISLLRLFDCYYNNVLNGDHTQVRGFPVREALSDESERYQKPIKELYVKNEKIFNKWSKNIIRQKFTAYAIPNGLMSGHVT